MGTIVGLNAAAAEVGVTHPTILTWCRDYGIGTQADDGVWHIDRSKLLQLHEAKQFLEGVKRALVEDK